MPQAVLPVESVAVTLARARTRQDPLRLERLHDVRRRAFPVVIILPVDHERLERRRRERVTQPKIALFRDWLLAQVQADPDIVDVGPQASSPRNPPV